MRSKMASTPSMCRSSTLVNKKTLSGQWFLPHILQRSVGASRARSIARCQRDVETESSAKGNSAIRPFLLSGQTQDLIRFRLDSVKFHKQIVSMGLLIVAKNFKFCLAPWLFCRAKRSTPELVFVEKGGDLSTLSTWITPACLSMR